MMRMLVIPYGIISYVLFLGVFLYAIGFIGNILVPKSIDSGTVGPIGIALGINALILGLFAIRHSIMARTAFKTWIQKFIPEAAERSTYVMATNLIFLYLFWQWRPIGGVLWNIEGTFGGTVLQFLFWLGWGIVLFSTFLIDHFELFGLRQVTRFAQNKEHDPPRFPGEEPV